MTTPPGARRGSRLPIRQAATLSLALVLGSCGDRSNSPSSTEGPAIPAPSADSHDAAWLDEGDASASTDVELPEGTAPAFDGVATVDRMDAGPPVSCGGWGASLLAVAGTTSVVAAGYSDGFVTIQKSNLEIAQRFQAHDTVVRTVALSSDGTLLATSSDGGEIRLWSVADGHRVGTLSDGAFDEAPTLTFSPDNHFLAALDWSNSRTLVFDLDAGKIAWSLVDSVHLVHEVFFSDGGSSLFTLREKSDVTVYSRTDGRILRTGLTDAIVPSPDGSLLAGVTQDINKGPSLVVARTSDLQVLRRLPLLNGESTVAFSGDGSVLVAWGTSVARETPSLATAWRTKDFALLGSWTWPVVTSSYGVLDVASGPGATLIVVDIAGQTSLVDSRSGQVSATSPGRGQWGVALTVRFSPDGSLIATKAYYSGGNDSLVVWGAASQTKVWSLSDVGLESFSFPSAHAFAFSFDNQYVFAVSWDGSIRVLGTKDGAVVRRFGQRATCVAPSPDGKVVYACGTQKAIDVYRMPDGTAMQALDPDIRVNEIAVSPQGTLLAAAYTAVDRHGGLAMYRLSDGRQIWKQDEQESPNTSIDSPSIAFSPDGRMVALARRSVAGLRLYDASSGEMTLLEPSNVVAQADFSSDSRFIAAGTERGVDLIRLGDGKVVETLARSWGVAFSPVTDRLVAGDGSGHVSSYCGVLASLNSQP